jgi:hypothetical protein
MAEAFMVRALWWRIPSIQAAAVSALHAFHVGLLEPGDSAQIGYTMRHATLCLMLIGGLLTGCGTLGSHPPKHLDISGQWQLDESLSDDPMAVMREHRSGDFGGMRRHGGGGMGGMGGTGGPGHHGGGGQGGGPGGGWSGGHSRHAPGSDFLVRPEKLSIQQGTNTLKLIADGVPTDFEYGEKVMASVQGGAAERVSGWKGQDFVVKYKVTEGGPTATRSYELGEGGRELIVHTEVSGERGGTRKLRTVYEREPGVTG